MSLIPPDGQGGYVVGSRAPANGGPWRQPLLLQLDTALQVQGCSTDPEVGFGALAVGTHYIYAVVMRGEGSAQTWGIARFPQ